MVDHKEKKNSANSKFTSHLKTSYFYVIKGNPIPLARARHGNRKTWDSQKQIKLITGLDLEEQHHGLPLLHGPLFLDICFYFSIPESYSLRKREKCIGTYHEFKPDLSNLIKFVEDIAMGIIYKDDCIISSVTAKKIYDEEPRTELFIMELNT